MKIYALSILIFLIMAQTAFAGNKGYLFKLPVHRIQKIVVDAGHGGKDPGTASTEGVREKDLALEMALRLRDDLKKEGFEVLTTRDTDVFIPLSERARLGNTNKADLFVSVHVNASMTPSLKGFEVYALSEAVDDVSLAAERAENAALAFEKNVAAEPTKELKTIYWDLRESENRRQSLKVSGFIADAVEKSVPIAEKRLRGAKFYVLKWSESPAVLVETGYLSNDEDKKRLMDAEYRKKLVGGVAAGIVRYKNEFEKTNGSTK